MLSRRPRRRRGFTLMEVLLVLAILVILGSLVTVSFVRMQATAYKNSAKSQVGMLEQAVKMYVLNVGSVPTQQEGLQALLVCPSELKDPTKWTGPYLDKQQLPNDPWNQPYQYEPLGADTFRIWSNGPDQASGTPDDISTTL
jgi:general secretion pathway protein G